MFQFVSESGGWEWSRFEYLLPNEICDKIAAILPPNENAFPDKVGWK